MKKFNEQYCQMVRDGHLVIYNNGDGRFRELCKHIHPDYDPPHGIKRYAWTYRRHFEIWVEADSNHATLPLPNRSVTDFFIKDEVAENTGSVDNLKIFSINDIKSCFASDRSFVGVQWLFDRMREKINQ